MRFSCFAALGTLVNEIVVSRFFFFIKDYLFLFERLILEKVCHPVVCSPNSCNELI